jgi:hypothetical protein
MIDLSCVCILQSQNGPFSQKHRFALSIMLVEVLVIVQAGSIAGPSCPPLLQHQTTLVAW